MVPPQHCPSEYSNMPTMIVIQQQQQQQQQQQEHQQQQQQQQQLHLHLQQQQQHQHQHQHQHQQQQQLLDSHTNTHPGKYIKDITTANQYLHHNPSMALPFSPLPPEYKAINETESHSPQPISSSDISTLSDDHQYSMDNSISSLEFSQLTTNRTRQQSQGLQGQHTQINKSQRQRRATTDSAPNKGVNLGVTSEVKNISDLSLTTPTTNIDVSTTQVVPTIPSSHPLSTPRSPYTQFDNSNIQLTPTSENQPHSTESTDTVPIEFSNSEITTVDLESQTTELDPAQKEEKIQDSPTLSNQQTGVNGDISPRIQESSIVNGFTDSVPDHSTSPIAISEGYVPEGDAQAEEGLVGVGIKRNSRQMSVVDSSPLMDKPKEISSMPAKKKVKTEQTKKNVNDTASLFQKIFADRDPGKRKIKTKSVHEIPMDLAADEDDSDFEDTKVDSNDDDDEDMMLDEVVSEDEQQDTFNDEQDLMTALWQWKDNDPEVCCVCLGRSTEADNVFVYCDTLDCALCVHQACYGVRALPSESEPWLCDRCKAPPEEVVSCVCCPSKDGAFRKLVPEDPSKGWVHVVCALWLPETTLGDPDNVDKISVRDIPEKNWTLTCYMCTDPQDAAMGACVQCDAGQCRKSFHITCAQGYSLLETIEDSDMADPYFMYCKQHGVADGHAKLNGWAKWVKQRDAFLKKWQEEQGRKRTFRLIEMQRSGCGDEDGGDGLIEMFEHSYSRFKHAREKRIARERSELSRQYSIGYYLDTKIDKSRSRLEVISTKAEQALLEQRRIEAHTRNLLSSLLECAQYLESVDPGQLEAPLSIDTTLEWYNSLPDTSRWKSNIQDIIETIDIDSLSCDNPYTQPGSHGVVDSGLEDSEAGQRHGRSLKGIYGKLSKKGNINGAGKNVKSKKVHPKPSFTNKSHATTVFTSSRGRQIKRDVDSDEYLSAGVNGGPYGSGHLIQTGNSPRLSRAIMPCTVCHQLTLPEHKLELERDADGVLSPTAIKVLNRMVACDTCHRMFHPKCLNPPMSRVPPRGYSWNCEDCDSSEESQESGGESSPTHTNSSQHQHHHSQSSDLDEALMVLADTAMTMSATGTEFQPATPSRAPKRPLTSHGHGSVSAADSGYSATMATDGSAKVKEGRLKKIKTEAHDKPKMIRPNVDGSMTDESLSKLKGKKSTKSKDGQQVPGMSMANGSATPSGQPITFKPAVAPIIRGNLRIYPPGPHIAPKVSGILMKQIAINNSDDEEDSQLKKSNAKTKASKKLAGVKSTVKPVEAGESISKNKKVKSEGSSKVSTLKGKKSDPTTESTKGKTSETTIKKKASAKEPVVSAISSKKVSKATGPPMEGSSVRGASLPAVPVPAPPKPKELIRYTVGEKTVEELAGKEDVEIERRENVKFRKLRGRTLKMPAPPQEVLLNASTLAAEAEAAAAAAAAAASKSQLKATEVESTAATAETTEA